MPPSTALLLGFDLVEHRFRRHIFCDLVDFGIGMSFDVKPQRYGRNPFMATLVGVGIIWATQVPVHGHFLKNLAGPFLVTGAGTAFSFIPISIAALAGVEEHRAGLASGLLNTSQQLGGALGVAIASSVAASHTKALLHVGTAAPAALTAGFQHAFLVLGAIALIALPAILALVRRSELSAKVSAPEARPALSPAS